MNLIFRKEHIELIKQGLKTQTRRRHRYRLKAGKVYDAKESWFRSKGLKILIARVYSQCLGDITAEEAVKEGGYTVDEFKRVWKQINESWDPDEVVTVYEFKLHKLREPDQSRLDGFSSKPRHRP